MLTAKLPKRCPDCGKLYFKEIPQPFIHMLEHKKEKRKKS